jgi:hypothetical protein
MHCHEKIPSASQIGITSCVIGARTDTPCPRESVVPKGLICLACAHSQPEKKAAPMFWRMLAQPRAQPGGCARSQRSCRTDRGRETEIVRIKQALQRAEELGDDVAAAIEGLPGKTK